uniref:Trihelix transcription factor ASIL2 n=1 Tax=Noccaea caerulescens TaxID=107243 RepID=A0A1J3IJ84_NOCCA
MMKGVNDSFSPGSFRPSPSTLSREDCWSEEATFTLIQAWGGRYVDLSRGNLRQKHWQEVANAVNDRHFNTGRNVSAAKSQPYRTDVQCKNRIDTLKKKYKLEKARVSESTPGASYISPWPFFSALDDLLGESFPTSSAPDSTDYQRLSLPMAMIPVPVAPRSAIPRRPAPAPAIMPLGGDNLLGFRGNLNAFAAAAAAAACPASEDDSEGSRSRSSGGGSRKREREVEQKQGYKEVAEAIEKLGQIYERVEERKRKEMVELEKQRMRFAKELECHRMQLFTEMQVRLHKLRRTSGSKGPTSSASAALDYGLMDFPSYF